VLNDAWHHGFVFWLYGGFAILAAFVVMRYVPETRGVDANQLAGLWRREEGTARTE
jgi:SP family xylose:H+ symportor-like MFS transporter